MDGFLDGFLFLFFLNTVPCQYLWRTVGTVSGRDRNTPSCAVCGCLDNIWLAGSCFGLSLLWKWGNRSLWALFFSQVVSNLSCNSGNGEVVPAVSGCLTGSLSWHPHQTWPTDPINSPATMDQMQPCSLGCELLKAGPCKGVLWVMQDL